MKKQFLLALLTLFPLLGWAVAGVQVNVGTYKVTLTPAQCVEVGAAAPTIAGIVDANNADVNFQPDDAIYDADFKAVTTEPTAGGYYRKAIFTADGKNITMYVPFYVYNATGEVTYEIIDDFTSWTTSYNGGGLKLYYTWYDPLTKPYLEDLWNTDYSRAAGCDDALASLVPDWDGATTELHGQDHMLTSDGYLNYQNCVRDGKGAFMAPGAAYPWIVMYAPETAEGTSSAMFIYDGKLYTFNKVFSAGKFLIESLPTLIGDENLKITASKVGSDVQLTQGTFNKQGIKFMQMPALPTTFAREGVVATTSDIILQLGSINTVYGEEAPAFSVNDFVYTPLIDNLRKDEFFAQMRFSLLDDAKTAGEHAYTVEFDDKDWLTEHGINAVAVNNGHINIAPRSLNNDDDTRITFDPVPEEAYDCTGSPIKPEVGVKFDNVALVAGTDYTVAYGENTLPATGGTVTVKGITNFKDEKVFHFAINPTATEGAIVTVTGVYTYTGSAIQPEAGKVTVTLGTETISSDFYDLSYGENTNVIADVEGEEATHQDGSVIVTFKGIYSGTATGYFDILPKNIGDDDVVLSGVNTPAYNGGEIPALVFTLTYNEVALTDANYDGPEKIEGQTYDKGAAKVKVTGKGNYTGEKEIPFTIKARSINGGSAVRTITVDKSDKYYTGDTENPIYTTYTIVSHLGGVDTELVEGTDYTVTYDPERPINVGKVTVTFTGKGNWSNFATATYNIVKKPITITGKDFAVGRGSDTDPEPVYTTIEGLEVTEADITAIGTLTYQYKNGNTWSAMPDNTSAMSIGDYNYRAVLGQNADQNNYAITISEEGVMSVIEAQVIGQVDETERTFGATTPAFSVSYKAGLSGETTGGTWRGLLNGTTINYTVWKVEGETETEVTEAAAAGTLAVGTYTIKAGGFSKNGYLVSFLPGTLTVSAADVATVTANITFTAEDYTGSQITPEVAESENYDVTYGENINAGTNAGSVTFTGKGNYAGTVTKNFTINKLTVTIKAKDAELPYSAIYDEPTYEWEIVGLVDADKEKPLTDEDEDLTNDLGFTGVIRVVRTGTWAVGTHTGKLELRYENNPSFRNYDVNQQGGANGTLIVTANETPVIIAIKNLDDTENGIYSMTYGDAFAPIQWEYVSGLPANEVDNVQNIIKNFTVKVMNGEAEATAIAIPENKVTYAAGEYTLVGTASSANYTVQVTDGTLKVDPKPVTVNALDQTVAQGEDPESDIIWTGDNHTVALAEGSSLVANDQLALTELQFVAQEEGESITALGEHAGAIQIVFSADENPNYEITAVAGKLTVEGEEFNEENEAYELVLDPEVADADAKSVSRLLSDYNGQNANVTIVGVSNTLKNTTCSTLLPDVWYTLVLPFETTVKEISKALGYAVVDVPNEDNTTVNSVSFNLKVDKETIPANTMILIKTDEQRILKSDDTEVVAEPIVFKGKTIAYNPEYFVKDDAGNEFHGVYTRTLIGTEEEGSIGAEGLWFLASTSGPNNKFFHAGAKNSAGELTNKRTLLPLCGYFKSAATDQSGVRVFVEEADGRITAISGITMEADVEYGEGWYTINGMKLNAAPTQKGIYINNGKKIVIK